METDDLTSTRQGSTWEVAAPAAERVVHHYLRLCPQHQGAVLEEIESEYREREAGVGLEIRNPRAFGVQLATWRALGHLRCAGHGVTDRLDSGLNRTRYDENEAVDVKVDVDRALESLRTSDPQAARAIEMKYLHGFDIAEIADALEISQATVHRLFPPALLFLRTQLKG